MRKISALALALLLSACGGGGGDDAPAVAPENPSVQAPETTPNGPSVPAPGEVATEDAPVPSDPVISLSPTAPYDDLNSDLSSLTTPSTTASTFCGYTGGGSRITGTVSKVHDGDTITVAGYSIRLDSIDAPELKQAYGVQSRDNLANLVNGQPVTVTYAKKDKYGRIVGTVFKSDCTQVNLRQVETGSAWYYEAYKCEISGSMRNSYSNAQLSAQANDRGLWALTAISPWVYRNGVEAKVPASCKNDDMPSWDVVTTPPVTTPPVITPPVTTPPTSGGGTVTPKPPAACQAQIWVNAYTRKDGTRVKGHWRKNPNC